MEAKGGGKVLGFITTVAGMLIFALMIGVVSDSIGTSVDDLKRGNAKVMHLNHRTTQPLFALLEFDE